MTPLARSSAEIVRLAKCCSRASCLVEMPEWYLAPISIPRAIGMRASGAAQILALLPGISRSGVTMVAGLMRGLNHDDAARFSFPSHDAGHPGGRRAQNSRSVENPGSTTIRTRLVHTRSIHAIPARISWIPVGPPANLRSVSCPLSGYTVPARWRLSR
jgi:hypothetical protein